MASTYHAWLIDGNDSVPQLDEAVTMLRGLLQDPNSYAAGTLSQKRYQSCCSRAAKTLLQRYRHSYVCTTAVADAATASKPATTNYCSSRTC